MTTSKQQEEVKMMMATFRFHGSTDEDRKRCFCDGEYYSGKVDPMNDMYFIITDDNGDEWRIHLCDKEFEVYDIYPA